MESIIRREVMAVIQRELSDPRITGMPSVTRVQVTEDMAQADIFFTIMGTAGKQSACLNALKHSAGLMRTRLSEALNTRTVPVLRLFMDEKLQKELSVLDALDRVAAENAELDRQRAARDGVAAPEPQAAESESPAAAGEPQAGTPDASTSPAAEKDKETAPQPEPHDNPMKE